MGKETINFSKENLFMFFGCIYNYFYFIIKPQLEDIC